MKMNMYTPYFGGPTLAFMKMLLIQHFVGSYTNKNFFHKPYFRSNLELCETLNFLHVKNLIKSVIMNSDKEACNIIITNKNLKDIQGKIDSIVDHYKTLKNSGGNFRIKSLEGQRVEVLDHLEKAIHKYNYNNLPIADNDLWQKFWENNLLVTLLILEKEGFITIHKISTIEKYTQLSDGPYAACYSNALIDVDMQRIAKYEKSHTQELLAPTAYPAGGRLKYYQKKGELQLCCYNDTKLRCNLSKRQSGRKNWAKDIFDILWKLSAHSEQVTWQVFMQKMERETQFKYGIRVNKAMRTCIKRSLKRLSERINHTFKLDVMIIDHKKTIVIHKTITLR